MLEEMLKNFLKSEMFMYLVFIVCGFLFSIFIQKLKVYIEKTPNKIDDAIFNFLVNDIFLKVEKQKLDDIAKKYNINFKNLDKATQAIKVFQICYKEQTGQNADASILAKAKAVWSELATIYPSKNATITKDIDNK
jgi:hypothetical protein